MAATMAMSSRRAMGPAKMSTSAMKVKSKATSRRGFEAIAMAKSRRGVAARVGEGES